MKEWKKPLVKVVIVEEDVIATSSGQHTDGVSVGNLNTQDNNNVKPSVWD